MLLALRKEQFGKHGSQMSDEEPLYDSVASDDDYATFASDNVTRLSTALISDNEVQQILFGKIFLKFK